MNIVDLLTMKYSRYKVEKLISKRKIRINGRVIVNTTNVSSDDRVDVNGKEFDIVILSKRKDPVTTIS